MALSLIFQGIEAPRAAPADLARVRANIAQFQNGSADWATAGTSMFGACLRATANAAATWTSTGSCPNDNTGSNWFAVPTMPSQVAMTATGDTGTANLRFGLAIHGGQAAGALMAPIEFSVIAP